MSGIIIATPDAELHNVLEAEITGERIDVFWATEGHEAWHHALENIPDMVLLDINLEIYGAFELCSMFRGNPDMPSDLPIILLIDGDINVKQLKCGGFTAMFHKPHVVISLREMIYSYIKPEALPQQIFD